MRESDFLTALRFQRAADYLSLAKKELSDMDEPEMAAEIAPLIHQAKRASVDWISLFVRPDSENNERKEIR